LADGLEIVLGVDDEPQARADDGVVVDNEDANAQTGTSATIIVPPEDGASMRSSPSSSRTRSRIPSTPSASSRTRTGSNPTPSSVTIAATVPGRRTIDTETRPA